MPVLLNLFLHKRIAILSTCFLIAVLFLFSVPALAADNFGLDETAVELGLEAVPDDLSIRETVINIIKWLIGFIGIVAIVMILYGGVRWMTAGGSVDKLTKAKKVIINATIGLMICILSYAIVYFIAFQLSDEIFGDGSGGDGTIPHYSGGLGGGAIASHYPPRGAVGVPRNINIVVTFRDLIDSNTITDETVVIRNNTDDYENAWLDNVEEDTFQRTFVFHPVVYLGNDANDSVYIVTLGNNIENSEGEKIFGDLGYEYTWQFTVSTEIDVTPPRVVSVYPLESSGDEYPRNTVVQMVFSEPVIGSVGELSTSSSFSNIQVYEIAGPTNIEGSYIASNNYQTSEFLPATICGQNSCGEAVHCFDLDVDCNDDLTCTKPYGAKISTNTSPQFPYDGIVDMAGNALDGDENGTGGEENDDKIWDFEILNSLDLQAPGIYGVTPSEDAQSVGLKNPVNVTFTELMMSSSLNADSLMIGVYQAAGIPYWITNSTINIVVDDTPVSATVGNINHDTLGSQTTYESKVKNSVRDINQNCLVIDDSMVSGYQPGFRNFQMPTLEEGLVGHWDLNEGVGNTVNDLSGLGNTGTLSGLQADDWITNSTGQAIDFDGDRGYVNIIHNDSLVFTGPFSVSFWVKLTTDPLTFQNGQPNWVPELVSKSSWARDWRIRFWSGGRISFLTYGLSNTGLNTDDQVLFQDQYVHVVTVWDGSSKIIYIDSQEVKRADRVTGSLNNADHNLGIAANRGGSESFKGIIDNVRIYNRALTSQEVTLLYDTEYVE